MMKKISVVVPIYNVEKYLERCLESIINQTYKDLEIILVDDGSPDNCPKMCDDWAVKDSRIKVIHKKNEGLGYARNSGMEIATGDYITFVDSDDCLMKETYSECIKYIETNNAEVVSFGFSRVLNNVVLPATYSGIAEGLYLREQILSKVLPNAISPLRVYNSAEAVLKSACVHVYSIALLKENNIRFSDEKMVLSEDFCFNIEVYTKMKSIYILKKAFYYYYYTPNSITTKYNIEKYYAGFRMYDEYELKIKNVIDDEILKERLNLLWLYLIYTHASGLCHKETAINYKRVKNEIKLVLNDDRLHMILPYIGTEGWIMKERGILYLFKLKSPFLFYYAYKLIVRK